MIHRSFDQLPWLPLNHDSGDKKVLFSYQDKETPCHQISHARFRTGDHCEAHLHPTLDEHFYWLSGAGRFVIQGKETGFKAGDYIYVPAGAEHEIHISADAECVCIGIALDMPR